MNKLEWMAADRNTGEMACGPEDAIKDTVKRWLECCESEEEKKKIYDRKYNKFIWDAWCTKTEDDPIFTLIDCLQSERRITVCNFSEYRSVTEFLYLHDSPFSVTKINSDKDVCEIRMLDGEE